jgi:hypothetical protein
VVFLGNLVALAIGVALGFVAVPAHAQSLPTSSAGVGQYGVPIGSVTALTVPQFAAAAEICVETAAAVVACRVPV